MQRNELHVYPISVLSLRCHFDFTSMSLRFPEWVGGRGGKGWGSGRSLLMSSDPGVPVAQVHAEASTASGPRLRPVLDFGSDNGWTRLRPTIRLAERPCLTQCCPKDHDQRMQEHSCHHWKSIATPPPPLAHSCFTPTSLRDHLQFSSASLRIHFEFNLISL